MIKTYKGAFRRVIKLGNVCLKFSRVKYGYRSWVYGVLMNLQEAQYFKSIKKNRSGIYNRYKYCPVWFTFFGFFNVIPFCSHISKDIFEKIKKEHFPFTEHKQSSYGVYKGRIVSLDYTDFGVQGEIAVVRENNPDYRKRKT